MKSWNWQHSGDEEQAEFVSYVCCPVVLSLPSASKSSGSTCIPLQFPVLAFSHTYRVTKPPLPPPPPPPVPPPADTGSPIGTLGSIGVPGPPPPGGSGSSGQHSSHISGRNPRIQLVQSSIVAVDTGS